MPLVDLYVTPREPAWLDGTNSSCQPTISGNTHELRIVSGDARVLLSLLLICARLQRQAARRVARVRVEGVNGARGRPALSWSTIRGGSGSATCWLMGCSVTRCG